MNNEIRQKIIITGASQGIGKALAMKYAKRNADIVLLARNTEALEEITKEINSSGRSKAYYMKCDVSKLDDMCSSIDFALSKMRRIDLAILNAGFGATSWFDNFDSGLLKKIFEVNVFGLAYGIEALIPVMKKQGGGTIAGVSSLADTRGFPGSVPYCASKAAATHLLEGARIELKVSGINVITVKPGFVWTNMTANNKFYMPFLMETEKAADIIIDGIDKEKKYIKFPMPMAIASELGKMIPSFIFEPVIRKWKKPLVDKK